MELRSIASYADAVRPHLSPRAFEPARSRLLWLPFHASIIAVLAWAITAHHLPTPLWLIASLVIGVSMSAIAFLGHEVLHGAVVRGRRAIRVLGWICLLPFTVSPTLWTNWHNRVHHNHCAKVGADPDMYPTLDEYRSQFFARVMADYFGLGGRRWRSLISLLLGFTGQSQQMLWEACRLGFSRAHCTGAPSLNSCSAWCGGSRSRWSLAASRSCSSTCCRSSSRTSS